MAIEIRMPRLTSSMVEGTIHQWLKREGDTVVQGQPLLVVESDKAAMEVDAPASGTLLKIVQAAGKAVEVEQIVAYIGMPGEQIGESESPQVESTLAPAPRPGFAAAKPPRVPASPAAKRLAAERGVDLSKVAGSGAQGLILESDVLAYLDAPVTLRTVPGSPYGQVTELPLTPVQRAMSQRMLASQQNVVQGTTFAQVDMTAALELRKRAGVGITALVGMAAIRALAEHPVINSCLMEERVRLHDYVNLGVAVATERGLVVPVIHNAEKLDLYVLSEAIADLTARVRRGPLSPREMSDATFTITNSGALGAPMFVPVVSFPESAILGIGEVVETPVVRDGAIVVRRVMRLALSYNHRIIDGATAVPFLKQVRALLEDPMQL